jgi:glycosyltransferase involved in cell wall biosynthesis
MLRVLRRSARHLIFDFDDAVLYRDSYDPRGPESPKRYRRFAATVRAADTVVAGNDFLADCALRAGARAERVRVIPTCVDTDRYEPSEGSGRADGIDLAWIGSSSTLQGLEQNRPLWRALADHVPGVRLRVICDRVPDLGALPVVPVEWSEPTEARELAAADAGLSWVPDDVWSRGKCALKVLQYQAAGLPVVANPVGVHEDMVRPGVTGWLPRDPAEWVESIRALADDPPGRRRMGRAARAAVEADYSVRAWESAFVATVAGASAVPAPGPSVPVAAARHEAARGPLGARG